jgi:uncharacterized lipoprotein YddW (UPF0748 family)
LSDKEDRRARQAQQREQEEQREQEVLEVLQKLRFLESQRVHPQVTPDGKVAVFVGGADSLEEGSSDVFADVIRAYRVLHEMHKSARERKILIQAWKRFQEEE